MCVRILPFAGRSIPLGVTALRAGRRRARFADLHTIETESGLRLQAEKDHHLHGRREPAALSPRLRVHRHSQRRVGSDLGPAVDVGHWRGSDRSAGRFDHSAPSVHGSNSSRLALAFCRRRTKTYRLRSRPPSASRE